MGATGSGKSSIVNLLQRFYDVSDGAVKVDGTDVRKLSLKQLRSSISVVLQDVFLFSDTIEENIKMGQRKVMPFDEIRRAADCAQAKDFIEKMDEQYATVIGERGVGLSGGQKQRISIARAIAKKAPILSFWLIPSGTVAKRMHRRITASARMLQKKIFLFLLFQRPVKESCVIVFIIVRYLSMFSFRLPASFFPPHMACHYHIIPQNVAFVPSLPYTGPAF